MPNVQMNQESKLLGGWEGSLLGKTQNSNKCQGILKTLL